MSVIEASDVLRAVMLSGLTGFVVFCACYAIAVWRKRNRDRGPRGGLLRLGTLLFLLGSGGVIGCWVANEFSTRDGIVSGEELFVVHAKRDVNIVYLADYAPVSEGQVIAELVPPSMNGQMAVLASRIEEAQARVRALGIKPLAIDPVLLQRQPQLRAQIDQSKQMQFDLRRSRRDLEKEQEALLTAWAREKGQLESELATAKKLFETSTGQIKLAEASLARAQEMLRLHLTSAQVADDRSATILHHTLERDKARVSIESLARRIAILDDHNSRSNLAFSSQCAAIDKDLSQIAASLENLQAQYSQLEKELTEDRTRATSSASLEVEAARYQLSALQAERDKVIAAARITAPFAGQVVYRHPSPGLAEENSPVLALSSGSGFTARVAMPTHEINQVAKEDSVQFALEQAVLSKFFGGRFRKAEDVPFEKARKIAHFDATLPAEVIALLGNSRNPVKIRLKWRPDLLSNSYFQGGSALGFLGLTLASIGMFRRPPQPVATRLNRDNHADSRIHVADLRMRVLAAHFHLVLREGQLTEDTLNSVESAIKQFGEDVISALRQELIFDHVLDQAIEHWTRVYKSQRLVSLIRVIKGQPLRLVGYAA